MDTGVSLLGKTIEFDCISETLGTFCFGFGTNLPPNYLRIGAGNLLGFGLGYSIGNVTTATSQKYNGLTTTSLHRYKIIISDTGTSLTLYIDNNLKTIASGSYTPNFSGTFIGFNGDNGGYNKFSYFSNLTIY